MTATATSATETRAVTGATTTEIEHAADAMGALRIAWLWGEVWRKMGGEWVSLSMPGRKQKRKEAKV
jgi:hypothetical protein